MIFYFFLFHTNWIRGYLFSDHLPTIIAGWGVTNVTINKTSMRLKVLKEETIDFNTCKIIYPQMQYYHICTGVRNMALNKAPCFVSNHFVQISYGTKQVNQE